MNKLYRQTKCPTEITVLILANKWAIPIIKELLKGPLRPSDLERNLKGLSAKTLAERLHDLKEWKIVSRKSFPEVPPRVEYSLTPLGRDLERILETLAEYGTHWQKAMQLQSEMDSPGPSPMAEETLHSNPTFSAESFDLEASNRL